LPNISSEDQRPPRWRGRFAVIALTLFITLLAIEIGLRVGLADVFPPRFFEPHAEFGHFHVPGRSGWQHSDEYDSYIAINSKGLRDPERPYAKPDGVFRVLMLGDSFVEGLQVDQNQTLPVQLEARLGNLLSRPVEVINAGVSRYGTDNSLLFLESEGLIYEPEIVIYAFYPNDVTDNIHNDLFELVDNQLIRHRKVISFNDRLRLELYDYSHTYRFALAFSLRLGQAADETLIDTKWGKISPIYRAELHAEEQYAWELTARLLERMSSSVMESGARLVVVCLPEDFQSQDRLWQQVEQSAENLLRDAPNRMLAAALPDGVPYLDLLPAFLAAQDQVLYYEKDHHFNPAGQTFAAGQIAAFLTTEGLIPAP